MFTSSFTALEPSDLEAASGGISPGQVPQQQQPQEDQRTWIERLNQNLKKRGFDPNIDPKMEIQPQNPEMDKGIIRPRPGAPQTRDA
jgi:hypothetical protein